MSSSVASRRLVGQMAVLEGEEAVVGEEVAVGAIVERKDGRPPPWRCLATEEWEGRHLRVPYGGNRAVAAAGRADLNERADLTGCDMGQR
mmetsp:Transcript_14338/g.25038  ORF Transcript_14338/g.25038 Transcript_14338/m.25038 type:complete len:90 (+) Transcript_14338:718-987(+)